jgi:hypothetical protein
MIPRVITDTTITFIAKGRPWMLAMDHPQFAMIRDALIAGETDEDTLVHLVDIRVAISAATGGKTELTEFGLTFNGELMSSAWTERAKSAPESLRVLLVEIGDQVRIVGDSDAPDGVYPVGDVDFTDAANSIFIESDDGFLGFVANTSIKEIIKGENENGTEDCDCGVSGELAAA